MRIRGIKMVYLEIRDSVPEFCLLRVGRTFSKLDNSSDDKKMQNKTNDNDDKWTRKVIHGSHLSRI